MSADPSRVKVSKERLQLLRNASLEQLRAIYTSEFCKEGTNDSNRTKVIRRLAGDDSRDWAGVTYFHLNPEMCKAIIKAEGARHHPKSEVPDKVHLLQKYLANKEEPAQEELGSTRKKAKTSELSARTQMDKKKHELTPADAKKILRKAGLLPKKGNVYYIIPPALGGANHMANLCVLPDGILKPPTCAEAARHYAELMADMLPTKKRIEDAIKESASYSGPTVDELIAAGKELRKKASLFPWEHRQSGQTGGNGAAAAGAGAAADAAAGAGAGPYVAPAEGGASTVQGAVEQNASYEDLAGSGSE